MDPSLHILITRNLFIKKGMSGPAKHCHSAIFYQNMSDEINVLIEVGLSKLLNLINISVKKAFFSFLPSLKYYHNIIIIIILK